MLASGEVERAVRMAVSASILTGLVLLWCCWGTTVSVVGRRAGRFRVSVEEELKLQLRNKYGGNPSPPCDASASSHTTVSPTTFLTSTSIIDGRRRRNQTPR